MKATVVIFLSLAVSYMAAGQIPVRLTCEYLESPLGIDNPKPLLAWQFSSSSPNKLQSAYEIIIAEGENDIRQLKGTAWASGKIASSSSAQIEYAGSELKSFTRYYWRVKIFDQSGKESMWSEPAWFETAMLDAADWHAHWISDGVSKPEQDEHYYRADRMPLFRKEFKATKKISSARLYISGLGYYEAYLNGKKIGDHVLDPGWTTYRKQVLYSVYDVGPLILQGNNVSGIILGNGWWNPLPFKFFGRWDLRDFQQTGRPCVKAEIHLRFTDGSVEVVNTDESWMTAPGPVYRNNVYLGESYDARLEQQHWNDEGATSNQWKNARLASGPNGTLSAQQQPPIKVTKVLKPVSIVESRRDTFIVDMGQNFAGVVQLKVKGSAGKKITIRYGEDLFKDGSLNVMSTVATQIKKGGIKGGPGAPATAWQEDTYILKGKGIEIWAPRFTFHGFRYAEITGWPGKPTVNEVSGLRMNSDLPVNGTFQCSDTLFNKIHEAIQWTFLSNVFSVQSDCPGREKMGYGADMVVSSEAFLFNYDMINFYGKSIRDFANEQRPLGGITEIAPFTGIDDRGFGDLSGPLGWELGFPYLQKKLYEFYGDERIIEQNYPAFQRQLEFLKSQAKNNLFYWDISDHESIDPKPESFSASVFYLNHVSLAAEFAGILGKRDDSLRYAALRRSVMSSIVERYLVPGTGRFDNATEASQIFALWYDLSPEKEKTLDVLIEELERHRGHLFTGIFSTKMFFDVMRTCNRADLAYNAVHNKEFPGWGFMLAHGATTLWEAWEYPGTGRSMNHPMFGSVDEWFYRSVLGINPLAPGFKKILIKPQPKFAMSWAEGSYRSIYGMIESDWKALDDEFVLHIVIPANTTAEVWTPCGAGGDVFDAGQKITPLRYEGGYAVLVVGSGEHTFRSGQ